MATKTKELAAAPRGGVVKADEALASVDEELGEAASTTQTKQRKAFELRKAGLTYDEIATRVGYASASGAYQAVQRVIAQAQVESVKEMRAIHESRLNDLLMVAYRQGLQGDLSAIRTAIDIMERQAALHGLDEEPAQQAGQIIVLGGDPDSFIAAAKAAIERQEAMGGFIDVDSEEVA